MGMGLVGDSYEIELFNKDRISSKIEFKLDSGVGIINKNLWLKVIHSMFIYEFCRKYFHGNLSDFLNYFDVYCNKVNSNSTEICNVITYDEDKDTEINEHKFFDPKGTQIFLTDIFSKRILNKSKVVYYPKVVYYWSVAKLKRALTFDVMIDAKTNKHYINIECKNEFRVLLDFDSWIWTLNYIHYTICQK